MPVSFKSRISAILAGFTCLALCGCGTAKVTSQRQIDTTAHAKPAVVYVSDFELDPSCIKAEPGLLEALPKMPGPFGDMLPGLPGAPKDPEVLSRKLVDSLSAATVKDLKKAGVQASRLAPGAPVPKSGWLVRGVFTEVNQGNQLRRSMIGFGAGKTDLQVVIDISDLTQGAPAPFYKLSTAADSGKAPGAAPTIVLGPAGAAARFVIAGKDLDRNVKQTAAKIAGVIVQRSNNSSNPQRPNESFSQAALAR